MFTVRSSIALGLVSAVLGSAPRIVVEANAEPRTSSAAQSVADLDRTVAARLHVGLDAKSAQKDLDRAVDRWLREELAALRGDTSDAAISQGRLVAGVAAARHRGAVAQEASKLATAMIRTRAASLEPMIGAGRWLDALDQMESWVPGEEPIGRDVKLAVWARVRGLVVAAEAHAASGPERYLYARMHRWLGEAPAPTADDAAMHTLATVNLTAERAASDCPVVTTLKHASDPAGTPVSVVLTLSSCAIQTVRGSEPRTASYVVNEPRSRMEDYTVDVEVTRDVTTYDKVCAPEDVDISGGTGPRNIVNVNQCHPTSSTRPVTTMEPETRTRKVDYTEPVTYEEAFDAATTDMTAHLDLAVALTGGDESVALTDSASARVLDESYTRQHGESRAARTDLDASLYQQLDNAAQAFVARALDAWALQRGRTRLARAQAAGDASARRALAIEAVMIAPSLAEAAKPLVGLLVMPAQLAALIAGEPAATATPLASGAGLELPPVSADLESHLATVELRHDRLDEAHHMDGLFGMGVGFQASPAHGNSLTWALEDQFGLMLVPSTSLLLARVDVDFQIGMSSNPLFDIAVRPELGIRIGPLAVGAVATAGSHVSYAQAPDTSTSAFGDVDGYGYLGYGAHAALYPGPFVIDALALRLYPGSGPAVRTRADAIIGYSPKGKYGLYYMARLHYVADGDVKDASASATHYTSAILGILVQF